MSKPFLAPVGGGFLRGAAAATLAVLAGVSCRGDGRSGSDQSADSAGVAMQYDVRLPVAGRYSAQDFGRLRWLEGSWRGRLPDGGFFYERYRLVDDSTIAMRDSDAVDFASERGASNNFTWKRDSPDRWTATLRSNDAQGRPRTTVYPMERVRR